VEIDYCEILVGNFEAKIPFEGTTPRRPNIKMKIRETGCENVNLNQLAKDKLQYWDIVNTIINLLGL
jgi:hypothetical protein